MVTAEASAARSVQWNRSWDSRGTHRSAGPSGGKHLGYNEWTHERLYVWQVLVNGMRVRIKLDQERLAELLGGMDSASIPGLLSHLGDVACLSFAPFHNGEPSHRQSCRLCPQAMVACMVQKIPGPDQHILLPSSKSVLPSQ